MAATFAVGVGVAIARAGLRRGAAPDPERPPELGLLPDEPLAHGLRRMAIEQADLAIALLAGAERALRPEAVHEVRKALKRLRALLRLLAPELGEGVFARENAVLRDLGRHLAGARDAEVRLDTLRALIERHPGKLDRPAVARLERRLVLEREGVRARALTDAAMRGEVVAGLRAFRARAAAWQLRELDRARLVEPGLARIYRRGRDRYRRAERSKGGRRTRALHVWRKSVKDLRYAGEVLSIRAPVADAGAHSSRNGAGARAKRGAAPAAAPAGARRLRRIARRADDLGELLGEEHDLALLAELVTSERAPLGVRLPKRTRRRLLRVIARRRRELRVRALRAGDALYSPGPKRIARLAREVHAGTPRAPR